MYSVIAKLKSSKVFFLIVIIIIALLCIVLSASATDVFANMGNFLKPKNPTLIISEYMIHNTCTVYDIEGDTPDWIEIYNYGEESILLDGIYISDNSENPTKFLLPSVVIEPSMCLLVYASGKESDYYEEIHASFKLNEKDECIAISNKHGDIIDIRNIEDLPNDISAGIKDDEWGYFETATPGSQNNTPISFDMNITPSKQIDVPIYINEFMTNNEYTLIDSFGDMSDWVELYNPNDYDISLTSYTLTDDKHNLTKWSFPKDTVIKANGYLLVFASGKNILTESNEIHASFSLGDDDLSLFLCQPNQVIVDSATLYKMPGNVSMGRIDTGKYKYFLSPTPGYQNSLDYEDELDADTNIVLKDIYISETSSGQFHFDRTKERYLSEYIEIYNGSDAAVNLAGYTISNTSSEPWVFPEVYINSKEYLVLLLKGLADENITSIPCDLSISSSGETLTLKDSTGTVIDYYKTGYLTGQYSSGRNSDLSNVRYFYTEKTPGKENISSTIQSYSQKPVFSHVGGMVDESSFLLEIAANEDASVYYTSDGSEPNEYSQLYTEPILIDCDSIIRASAYEENKLPSPIASATYILSSEHTLPIICISSAPENLFDYETGIYANGPGYGDYGYPFRGANFWKDWERPISFEYYETFGKQSIAFDAGIQVSGNYSRAYEQKSFTVRIRDEYGVNEIYYPFFEDNDVNSYKNLFIRSGGQDVAFTKMQDYYFHQSIKGYTDLAIMDGTPTVLYINGEYWGLYNLREKQNEDYLASHYGVDPNNLTIIDKSYLLTTGDIAYWDELCHFAKYNDLSNDEVYKQFCELVDIDDFIDYAIVETFFCNRDLTNVKFWRENTPDGIWRPTLFDLDMGITLYNYENNYLYIFFQYGRFGNLYYELKKNETFCNEFLQRYAYFLNEVFTEENISTDINSIKSEISPEIQRQVDRWALPKSVSTWESYVSRLETALIQRRYSCVDHLDIMFTLTNAEIDELFPWYYEDQN